MELGDKLCQSLVSPRSDFQRAVVIYLRQQVVRDRRIDTMLGHRLAITPFDLFELVGAAIDVEISRNVTEAPEMVLMGGAVGQRKIPYRDSHRNSLGNPASCQNVKFSFIYTRRDILRDMHVDP